MIFVLVVIFWGLNPATTAGGVIGLFHSEAACQAAATALGPDAEAQKPIGASGITLQCVAISPPQGI